MSTSSTAKVKGTSSTNLQGLLGSLAMGAKSANALPLTNSKRGAKRLASMQTKSLDARKRNLDDGDSEDDDIDELNDEDDELAYYAAFPEFNLLSNDIKESMTSVLLNMLEVVEKGTSASASSSNNNTQKNNDSSINMNALGKFVNPLSPDDEIDFDDPMLWEACSDACDALLERVEVYLNKLNDDMSATKSSLTNILGRNFKEGGMSKIKRIISGLVDVKKPQIVYDFANQVDNSRETPYIPRISSSLTVQVARPMVPIPGHGLANSFIPDDIVAPHEHYDNPFKEDIEGFEYQSWQLEPPSEESIGKHGIGRTLFSEEFSEYIDKRTNMLSMKGCAWIDSERDLITLVARLSQPMIKEIAIDLEAHSWRSFNGFTCLMQISVRPGTIDIENQSENKFFNVCDFIIDTLALRHHIGPILAPIFADPGVVKVMHGADSDIPWLQRDFGIYIVNLFDTGRASRALSFPSAGLAYLLSTFAGVTADKRHQLSDWRQRPLPDDMLAYARSDTHYLLDIYDRLICNLDNAREKGDGSVSIIYILDESRKVSLKSYIKEAFKPSGWKKISRQVDKFTPRQQACLNRLWDWRDFTARELDESTGYICLNSALVRIASSLPTSAATLHRLFSPIPPPLLESTQAILGIVTNSVEEDKDEKTDSTETNIRNHRISSLVKYSTSFSVEQGNDQVIKKVHSKETATTVFSDDQSAGTDLDEDTVDMGDKKGTRTCLLNPANKNSVCWGYMHHSLELDKVIRQHSRSICVDGLGAARASIELNSSTSRCIEDEVSSAIRAAKNIREKIEREYNVLHSFDTSFKVDDVVSSTSNNSKGGLSVEKEEKSEEVIKNAAIPKSIREMYTSSDKKRSLENFDKSVIQKTDNDEKVIENESHLNKKNKTMGSPAKDEQPFDYSGTEAMGLFNSLSENASSNPFFSGAARSLVSVSSLSGQNRKTNKKKGDVNAGTKHNDRKKVTERPQGITGKTHVYRK